MNSDEQLEILNGVTKLSSNIPFFKDKLDLSGIKEFKPIGCDIFQINMGKLCNQTCKHCHVNAGPDAKEIMSKDTMTQCLDVIKKNDFSLVDITGGAPEMNPHFRWFVEECVKLGKRIIVRCNLTVIFEAEEYNDLPLFFANNHVEVVSSLPFYEKERTDNFRGFGVFEKSIKALQMFNDYGYGYGKEGNSLIINLVYNPAGAFLPASQKSLENDFKQRLFQDYGIVFNNLFTITNMPVSRFLDYLQRSNNYVSYLENLVNAFNPSTALGAMCLNMVSVSWDGYLYDCDFNQILDMKISDNEKNHISGYDKDFILNRDVKVSQHCYGCTAGGGSSCGGETSV